MEQSRPPCSGSIAHIIFRAYAGILRNISFAIFLTVCGYKPATIHGRISPFVEHLSSFLRMLTEEAKRIKGLLYSGC